MSAVSPAQDALPSDHLVRARFAKQIDLNLSLIAPAGSGKTRAITDRIAEIASSPDAIKRLPKTVAVTYTNKAADELRQRAGAAIRARGLSERVLQSFEQSFFGTIHAFASFLLREFGYFIGVPAGFESAPDSDLLWKRYLQSVESSQDSLDGKLLCHVPFTQIQSLVEGFQTRMEAPAAPGPRQSMDLAAVLAYQPKRAASVPTVARGKRQIEAFNAVWSSDTGFAALPQIAAGGAEFIALAEQALAPANRWIRSAIAYTAAKLYRDFRIWRVRQGFLTYDDQISLAADLFGNPDAAEAIRERGYCILLDEAQDTDPAQFTVLLETARPVEAAGHWGEPGALPPAPGRFVMVGDSQQSIYSSRADLGTFRKAHALISAPGVGESLTFTTTFRCDRAVLDFVNQVGPSVLDGSGNQVHYVPLEPRHGAGHGETMVLGISVDGFGPETTADEKMRAEGVQIGAFLRKQGLKGLGISSWNEVAILAPRTAWLGSLRRGLLSEGVRSVVLSQSDRNCDRPAYLWTAAITTVLTEQQNTWEIVGVLRDIYGLSDAALADFSQGNGDAFRLDRDHTGDCPITNALRELSAVRQSIQRLPLRDAFEAIDRKILRPRLRALPIERYGDVDKAIDQMAAIAARIETEGGDLVTFAGYLRENFEAKVESQVNDPDAVCLLTNHKAKGLEWSVVILPALFRPFSFAVPSYPRIIEEDEGESIDVALCKADATAADTHKATRTREEIERLLYVSLTRAKRLLVLCDDRDVWVEDSVGEMTLAKALRLDARPETLTALPHSRSVEFDVAKKSSVAKATPFAFDIERAVKAAAAGPQKITPHRLVKDFDGEGPEARSDDRSKVLPYGATHYGTWWHDTMRGMPWLDRGAWQDHFDALLESCPDSERARKEWGLFLDSHLAQRLARAVIVRTECPFLVPVGVDAIEGVIDMVFSEQECTKWEVIDWKSTQSHTLASAIADYGPQIRPYRDVVAGMLRSEVTASIFLTKTGQEGAIP